MASGGGSGSRRRLWGLKGLRWTLSLHVGLLCAVSASHDFLDELAACGRQPFPAITLKNASRLNVCGETLEKTDLLSLVGSHWLNDKVCLCFCSVVYS